MLCCCLFLPSRLFMAELTRSCMTTRPFLRGRDRPRSESVEFGARGPPLAERA